VNEGTGRIKQVVFRTRFAIDAGIIVPVAALMILGSRVVDLLYDSRYHEAGWMLQVLSIRLILVATLSNSESCLVALGHPKIRFMENLCRTIAMFIAIPLGWSIAGIKGVIWAIALSEIPAMIVIWIGMMKHHMFSALVELRSLLFVIIGILVGLGLLHFWH
jgi:O-antigen/teichoic acid export membrane protein